LTTALTLEFSVSRQNTLEKQRKIQLMAQKLNAVVMTGELSTAVMADGMNIVTNDRNTVRWVGKG